MSGQIPTGKDAREPIEFFSPAFDRRTFPVGYRQPAASPDTNTVNFPLGGFKTTASF